MKQITSIVMLATLLLAPTFSNADNHTEASIYGETDTSPLAEPVPIKFEMTNGSTIRIDTDNDDDESLEADARTQSHNSSRSNRTEGVANPDVIMCSESEPFLCPDGTCATDRGQCVIETVDMGELRAEATSRTQTEARARAQADTDANTDLGGGDISEDIIEPRDPIVIENRAEGRRVRINGPEVRARVATNESVSNEEENINELVAITENNEEVSSIEASAEEVTVETDMTFRFLGIFPIRRDVVARITADLTELDLPWFASISTNPTKDQVNRILESIQNAWFDLSAELDLDADANVILDGSAQ